jgi:hypothetical protein
MTITPLPCPFCGELPRIFPELPEHEGNAFAMVECSNRRCFAHVRVYDGTRINDERGSESYKNSAIKRWNKRT